MLSRFRKDNQRSSVATTAYGYKRIEIMVSTTDTIEKNKTTTVVKY